MRRSSGFTLVEVLVALLVLALALTAWQLRISGQLDSAGYLRDKTLAQWVAHDQLQYLQLAQRLGQQLSTTTQRGSSTLAGRTWYWQSAAQPQALAATQQAGSNTLLQPPVPVVVSVAASSEELATNPLATLTGVLDAATR
jgi:general secretion pathway protein I